MMRARVGWRLKPIVQGGHQGAFYRRGGNEQARTHRAKEAKGLEWAVGGWKGRLEGFALGLGFVQTWRSSSRGWGGRDAMSDFCRPLKGWNVPSVRKGFCLKEKLVNDPCVL